MGLIDEESGWNGPEHVTEQAHGIEYMEYSQLINQLTDSDGRRTFDQMSLQLPKDGEEESAAQRLARTIVEACLQKSFVFKLAHDMIVELAGEELGSLWRANEGSDDMPGTYAHCLRHGMTYWN
jgi:hypothetical protein